MDERVVNSDRAPLASSSGAGATDASVPDASVPVAVRDLTKVYGTVTAVDHISFTLAPATTVALLGGNGAGKTTTLRAVSNLLAGGMASIVSGSAGRSSSLSGKVVETMDAGGYTYVLLEKKGAKTWVAVPHMKVTVGQEVVFQPGQEMANFKSRALNRTFERILFSGGPVVKQDTVVKQDAASDEAVKNAHGGKSVDELKGKEAPSISPKTPVVENVKVEKAQGPNAYSIVRDSPCPVVSV